MNTTADSPVETLWRSSVGESNAHLLRVAHPDLFGAIAELDAFGHRTMTRLGNLGPIRGLDGIISTLMVRRAVTHFVGFRHLCESSAVESAKLSSRALFETHLALRYLLFGGRPHVAIATRSSVRLREIRARYFYVAGERGHVYNRQAILDGRFGGSAPTRRERRRLEKEVAFEVDRLDRDYPTQSKRFGRFRCDGSRSKRRYFDSQQWYSFGFSRRSVPTVRALAKRLGLVGQYEFLYSAFSGLMHPTGVSHDGIIVDDSSGQRLEVLSPYLADAFPFLAYWTSAWQLLGLQWVSRVYIPGAEEDSKAMFQKTWPALRAAKTGLPTGLL
jgi:uncharacterized protein DUF5677